MFAMALGLAHRYVRISSTLNSQGSNDHSSPSADICEKVIVSEF